MNPLLVPPLPSIMPPDVATGYTPYRVVSGAVVSTASRPVFLSELYSFLSNDINCATDSDCVFEQQKVLGSSYNRVLVGNCTDEKVCHFTYYPNADAPTDEQTFGTPAPHAHGGSGRDKYAPPPLRPLNNTIMRTQQRQQQLST